LVEENVMSVLSDCRSKSVNNVKDEGILGGNHEID